MLKESRRTRKHTVWLTIKRIFEKGKKKNVGNRDEYIGSCLLRAKFERKSLTVVLNINRIFLFHHALQKLVANHLKIVEDARSIE